MFCCFRFCRPLEMNYGDPSQQQYYVQRMPAQQAQRMPFPPQQIQPPGGGGGQPQQQQQQTHQAMVYPTAPHQQQQQQQTTMMRMAPQQQQQHMYAQQQQQYKNFMQSLPQSVQAQIGAERDPERRKHLFHAAIQRQQQQQMFEQQQQHMAMMAPGGGTAQQPGPMAMRPMGAAQRMPMVQQNSNGAGGGPILFATTTTTAQQQQPSGTNVHFQRIPSQSSFVTSAGHSSSPTPMGVVANSNYQPRPSSAQGPQMFMANQQQQQHMASGGVQMRAAAVPVSGSGNQPQFLQQQQQQLLAQQQQQLQQQQQFHGGGRQFEQIPPTTQMQSISKTDSATNMHNYHQQQQQNNAGTSPAMDTAGAAQNRMPLSAVVKTEVGGTMLSAAVPNSVPGGGSVRSAASVPGGGDSVPHSVESSHPPSVGAATNGMAGGRPGSVQQHHHLQQQQQHLAHHNQHHHQVDTEEPEYRALLKQLCKYHADVKRLLGRFELDTLPGVEMKIKASLVNVIQVMEGTRKGGPVTKTLLQKLLSNVQTVLERHHISRHLFSVAKKLTTLAAAAPPQSQTGGASATNVAAVGGGGGGGTTAAVAPPAAPAAKEPFETDPWRSVRHLTIRVPDTVLAAACHEQEANEEDTADQQQQHQGVVGSDGLSDNEKVVPQTMATQRLMSGGRKRMRKTMSIVAAGGQQQEGVGAPPTKKSLLDRVAESFEPSNLVKSNEALTASSQRHGMPSRVADADRPAAEEEAVPASLFRVRCLDGTELVLGHTVTDALRKAVAMGFSVHTAAPDIEPPISRNAPTLQIRFGAAARFAPGAGGEIAAAHLGNGTTTELAAEQHLAPAGNAGTLPSLDVLVPVNFPDAPLVLFLHASAVVDAPSSGMDTLLDNIDAGVVDMYSLDALLSAWATAIASTDEQQQ